MHNGSLSGENDSEILIDPDYAIYDDGGNIIGQFDDDGNETFLEGKEPAKPADPQKPTPAPDGTKAPETKPQDPQKPVTDPKAAEQEESYLNHAHYILKMGGYELDEIEFENGEKVNIADLSAEQQLNILTSEFSRMREEYEGEISKAPKPQELPQDAQALVEFIQNGGTAKELAQYILDNDPDNAHKNLTDADLVLESIRKSMPGASQEDIQEEFDLLKEAGRVEKRAQLLRKQLGSGEIKLSDISQKHSDLMESNRQKELETEIDDAKKLTSYAKEVKEVAGVPIDPSVINSVLKNLIPDSPGEESNFLKSLNNPEKLLRYQFLDQYAEKIMEHVANESIKEGIELERQRLESRIEELEDQLNIKDKHLSRFSDKPIIQFSKKNGGKALTEPQSEEF